MFIFQRLNPYASLSGNCRLPRRRTRRQPAGAIQQHRERCFRRGAPTRATGNDAGVVTSRAVSGARLIRLPTLCSAKHADVLPSQRWFKHAVQLRWHAANAACLWTKRSSSNCWAVDVMPRWSAAGPDQPERSNDDLKPIRFLAQPLANAGEMVIKLAARGSSIRCQALSLLNQNYRLSP